MTTMIFSALLQVIVVGGLVFWGFRKERRLRRAFPERYPVKGGSHGDR